MKACTGFSLLTILALTKCSVPLENPFSNRKNNENDPITTKLSPVEELLKTLLKPIELAEGASHIIGKGVNNILSKLPQTLKNPIEHNLNSTSRGFGDVLNLFSDRFRAIYPGTLWCGDGDIARNEEDLGLFEETDSCCRDHDNCSDNLIANEERYGLLNNGIFTRSECSCDTAFYDCLKNARSIIATKIGITYFDILSPQCFTNTYPIVDCKETSRFLISTKCKEYNLDYNTEKKTQWFDNPTF